MSDEHEIVELERGALKRWCKGDPSGYSELFGPDIVYFDPFSPKRLDGRKALDAYYESLRGKISASRFELLNPKVQVIGEAAVLTFNFVGWDDGGSPHGWNCTEVYRHTPAGWQIIQSHWSLTQQSV